MATALGELFVELRANTGKFDAALVTSRGRVEGLAAMAARARDANGRFTAGVGAAATQMAGRYLDASGRMREANGRFVAGMGGASASVASASSSFGAFGGVLARGASALGTTFGGALRGVRAGLGGIVSAASAVGGAFVSLGSRMVLPALGVGAAGAGLIGVAVKQAADLEQAFSGLRKTTGLQGADLVKLQDDLKGLATTMAGVSFDDLLAIATMGGRMGITGARLNQFTKDIASVSIALDDIPAEESATAIARTLNVFKLGSENAIRFASALNKLDDSSTATGRDILDITARIAPTAATLGLSPQKVLAIATALKDAGAENEVAGSAISQIFGLMAKDMDAFAKVAGVSTAQFSAALRGDPMDALTLLIGSIREMDKVDAFSAVSSLGIDGVRATGTLLQLGTVMDRMGGFVRDANTEWSTTASIQNEVAVQGETTYAILRRLGNAVQIMGAEIGAFALPLVKALANSFGDLAGQVRGFVAGNAGSIAGFFAPLVSGARLIGLAFSNWPDFLDLAVIKVREVGLQVGTVLGRAGAGAFGALMTGGRIAFTFLQNVFRSLGAFLADLFTSVGENLKAQIGSIFNKGIAIPEIRANLALLSSGNLLKGIELPKLPGLGGVLGGLFGNLPNLDAEKAAPLARLDAARAAKERAARDKATKDAVGGFLNNVATGGNPLDMLPAGVRRGLPFAAGLALRGLPGVLARGGGRKESPAERARRAREAKEKARRDAAARRAKLTPASRRRAARATKGDALDVQIQILQDILGVNKSTDAQLKKGVVARLN